MESSNRRTARSWSTYDAYWMMPDFRISTGRLQSRWRSISRTSLRHAPWLVRLRTRPGMDPKRSHLSSISVCSDAWLSCTFRKTNERSWTPEPLPAYSLGTAYRLSSTSYTIHWPGRFTAPEMWYSEKESGRQHRMLQMKRSWTSTSTEMSSRNRNQNSQRTSQPEMEIPNVKRGSHCTTIHLRILQSRRRSHENWLAVGRHLEMHESCRPKVVAGTALGRIHWQSLHNWLSTMRNSRIWFPSTLQLLSPILTITRMASTIQSLTKQQPSLRSPTNGIRRWKKS